jgi:hypothetical protein
MLNNIACLFGIPSLHFDQPIGQLPAFTLDLE